MTNRIDMSLQQEFGFILHIGIPHMNYIVENETHLDVHTHSFPGTSCFYFWSKNHHDDLELEQFAHHDFSGKKIYVEPGNSGQIMAYWDAVGVGYGDYYQHEMEMKNVSFPDFKSHFSKLAKEHGINEMFTKPLCVINNKSIEEQGIIDRALNRIEKEQLELICDLFSDTHDIVYFRPEITKHTDNGFIIDDSEEIPWNDKSWIEKNYPNVILDNFLLGKYTNLNYNELQCMVHSLSETHFSVPGGNAVLASYFGGTNIIIGLMGKTRSIWNDDSHLRRISGAKIIGLIGEYPEKNEYDDGWKNVIQNYWESLVDPMDSADSTTSIKEL